MNNEKNHVSFSNNEITIKFNKLYNEWQTYILQPNISVSSHSEGYINNEPYNEIIKIGKPAIPLIIKKMEEGKFSEWKEGQFFLWYAVREITGVDLSKQNNFNINSEQEIAEKYIKYWKEKGF